MTLLQFDTGYWYAVAMGQSAPLARRVTPHDVPKARASHGRYDVYFVADFLRHESNASREAAIRAWRDLKRRQVPKTYQAWKDATQR